MNVLADILREIGTLTVPSRKGEVEFTLLHDKDLWITYREHNVDGTYTDPEQYKFKFTNK